MHLLSSCYKPGLLLINDPEALELAFHQGATFINAYFQAATNLVDKDSGVSNDLPWPRMSAPWPRMSVLRLAKSYEWIAMTF